MFRHERREKIMEQVESEGRVEVEELAHKFNVSVDSIRKDLQLLASQGRLVRVYGGACRIEPEAPTPATQNKKSNKASQTMGQYWNQALSSLSRFSRFPGSAAPAPVSPFNTSEIPSEPIGSYLDLATIETAQATDPSMLGRLEVAKRAYLEINSGDSIFLDVSRTNSLLADIIAQGDKRLIVTTNMIDVMQKLANLPHITVLGTGGYLNVRVNGFVGSATVNMLEPLLFAKAFVGASGIDLGSDSVTCDSIDSGSVKERVIHNASYKFLLVDHEKFDHKGNYRFASIDDFSAIITDLSDEERLLELRGSGVPVLTPL